MTSAGQRGGDVWLALMIGLRCDARCDTSWWWDYPPRDECDTLWQLSQILTHTWQMCDRSAAQKVHRGNFQGCRRIFNEIKNYLIIFFSNCSKRVSTLVSLSRQSLSLWKYSWPYLLQSWCLKHPPGPSHSAVVTSVAVYPPRTSVGGGCDEMMTTSGTRGWGHVGILIEYKESY